MIRFKRERRNSQHTTVSVPDKPTNRDTLAYINATSLLTKLHHELRVADDNDILNTDYIFDKYLKIMSNLTITTTVIFMEYIDPDFLSDISDALDRLNNVQRRWVMDDPYTWDHVDFRVRTRLDRKLCWFVEYQKATTYWSYEGAPLTRYGLAIKMLFNVKKCHKLTGLACWKILPLVEHLYHEGPKNINFLNRYPQVIEYCPISMLGIRELLSRNLSSEGILRVGKFISEKAEIGGALLDSTGTFVNYGVDRWWKLSNNVLLGVLDLGAITKDWTAKLITDRDTATSRVEMTAIIPTTDGFCWLCHDLFFGLTSNSSTRGKKPTRKLAEMKPQVKYASIKNSAGLPISARFESHFSRGHVDIKVTCYADFYMMNTTDAGGQVNIRPLNDMKTKSVKDSIWAFEHNVWNGSELRTFKFLLDKEVDMTVAGQLDNVVADESEVDDLTDIFVVTKKQPLKTKNSQKKSIPEDEFEYVKKSSTQQISTEVAKKSKKDKKLKNDCSQYLGVYIDSEDTNEKKKDYTKSRNKKGSRNPKNVIKKKIVSETKRFVESKKISNSHVENESLSDDKSSKIPNDQVEKKSISDGKSKKSNTKEAKKVQIVKTIPGAPKMTVSVKDQPTLTSIFEEYAKNYIDDEGIDTYKGSEFKAYYKQKDRFVKKSVKELVAEKKKDLKKRVKRQAKKSNKVVVATVLSNESSPGYDSASDSDQIEQTADTNIPHNKAQEKTAAFQEDKIKSELPSAEYPPLETVQEIQEEPVEYKHVKAPIEQTLKQKSQIQSAKVKKKLKQKEVIVEDSSSDELVDEDAFNSNIQQLHDHMPKIDKQTNEEGLFWYSIHTRLLNIKPSFSDFKSVTKDVFSIDKWIDVFKTFTLSTLKSWLKYFTEHLILGYDWIKQIISIIKELLSRVVTKISSWKDSLNQVIKRGIRSLRKDEEDDSDEEYTELFNAWKARVEENRDEYVGGRVQQTAEINGFGLVGHKLIPMTIGSDLNSHTIMDKNGIDYCISENTTRHGGHVGLRVLSDAMQLACIINAKCQRQKDPNNAYTIIDHGSKFSRVLPLLTPMMTPLDTLILARPMLNQADITYWANHPTPGAEGLNVQYSFGTFEELNIQYAGHRVIHLIHDVHYYLENFTANPGHSYYFSGIDFMGDMGNNNMVGVDYNIKNAIDYKLSFVTHAKDYELSDVCIEFQPNSNSVYTHKLQNITSLNRGMQLKEVIYDEHITFRALVIHGIGVRGGQGIPIRWKRYRNYSTPTDYLDIMTKNVLKLTGVTTDKRSTIRILQAKHDDPTSVVALAPQVISNCRNQEIEKKFYFTTSMISYLENFDVYRHVRKSINLFGIYDFMQDFDFELEMYPNLLSSLKSIDYYIGGVSAYSLKKIGGRTQALSRIILSIFSVIIGIAFYTLSFNISVHLLLFIVFTYWFALKIHTMARDVGGVGCYKYAIMLLPVYSICIYTAWRTNMMISLILLMSISTYQIRRMYTSLVTVEEKKNLVNYRSCFDVFVYVIFIQFLVQTIPIVVIDGFLSDHVGGMNFSDMIFTFIKWVVSSMDIGGGSYSFISRRWELNDFTGNSNLVSSWWGISKGYMWATACNDDVKNMPEPVQTGLSVEIGGYGVELYENIADSKATFTAIFRRQLLTHLLPDTDVVDDFQEFVANDIEHIAEIIVSKAIPIDIVKTINQTPGWPCSKKKKYIKHSFMALTNNKMCRSKMYYTAMVKTGEKYVSSRMVDWQHNSDRSRLIFVPESPAYTGLLTVVQRNVLKIVRDVLAGFSHGDSPETLKLRISHGISRIKKAISMSMDGSNHDGHQHISLIRAVDIVFWESLFTDEFMDKVFKKYNIRATNEEIRSIFELSTHEETATLLVKRNGKKSWALQIKGTTFSGSATRTTFGNTLRVLLYFHYYLTKLGIPSNIFEPNEDSFILVSGDDVVLWLDEKWIHTFESGIYQFVSKEKKGERGLGQCVESVHRGCWHSFDFCSKNSGIIDEQWILSRDVSKMLATSGWSRDGGRKISLEDHKCAIKDMLIHESFGLAVESWVEKLDVTPKGRELLHYYPMDVKFNPSGISKRAIYAEWSRMAKLTEKESIELLISLELYDTISLPEHYHLRPIALESEPRLSQPTCANGCVWCSKDRINSIKDDHLTPQGVRDPWLYEAYVAGSHSYVAGPESVCLTYEAELKIKTGPKRIEMNSKTTNSRKNFFKKNKKNAQKKNSHAKKNDKRRVALEPNSKQMLNAVDYGQGLMLESSSRSKPITLNNNTERGITTFSRQGTKKSRVLTNSEENKTKELFSELETARLHFNTARQFPGYPTPYVDGNTVYPLPTSVIETCFSRTAGSVSPIETGYSGYTYGVRDYTVIYLTPSITAMVKTGTSKYSGLNTEVVQSPTVSPSLASLAWNSTTMNDTWGTNLDTVGQRGFIFSASAIVRLEAPAATLSGTVYLGSFPAHSAHNAGTISVNDLMRAATRTQSCEEPIVLVNSVMDTGLIRFDSTNEIPAADLEEHIASEMVAYAVIEKGAVSITGGTNAEYSLSFELVGNTIWWPQFIDVQSMAVARSGQVSVAPMRKDPLLQNITSVNDRTPSHSLYSKAKEFLISQATAENLKKAWKFVKTTGVLKMLPFGIGAAAEFLKPPPVHCSYEERNEVEDLIKWLSRLPIPEEITDVGNIYHKECSAYRNWYYDFKCCLQKELENGLTSCTIKPIAIENDSKSDWRIAGDDSVLYKRTAR